MAMTSKEPPIFVDEVAPGSDLGSDVHELGQDRPEKTRVLKQLSKMSVIPAVFVFGLNRGKLRAPNQKRPTNRNSSEDQVRPDYAQSPRLQICVIEVLGF
jgi:hypothetical protein